jgi:hypothetical protein
MNLDQVKEFHGKYLDGVLKELHHETQLLSDWFKQDFPESNLKVIIDVDNILRSFTITTRVLMGAEMVDNMGFFQNKIVLQEKEIINPSFMRAFFKEFNNNYRKQIAGAINRHYIQEKAIESASN